ncbi:MAG: hypothetical protein LLG37_01620 [Spirochaetia bacterium]|nr:hypothetical protein [Spirochaetia bacterium]
MNQSQNFSQRQKQTRQFRLMPEQRLRSEILRLPAHELIGLLHAEAGQNPAVEDVVDKFLETEEGNPEIGDSGSMESELSVTGEEREAGERSEARGRGIENRSRYTKSEIQSGVFEQKNLSDVIQQQIEALELKPRARAVVAGVAAYIEPTGLLSSALPEIAAAEKYSLEEVERAVKLLHGFEPSGLAAVDVRECLMLQLERRKERGTLAYRILDTAYDAFCRFDKKYLAGKFRVKLADIENAIGEIRTLSLKPGYKYSTGADIQYITAEIMVTKAVDRFKAEVPDIFPELIIDRDIVKKYTKADKNAAKTAGKHLKRALLIEQAILTRRAMMKRIGQEILDSQSDYLTGKSPDLKPLKYSEIAARQKCSVSTVSRIVKEKYVNLEGNVLPLRDFFTGEAGSGKSTHAVRNRLKELISAEDKARPVTDEWVLKELLSAGFNVSIRAVTKYRTQLGIPPVKKRRAAYKKLK